MTSCSSRDLDNGDPSRYTLYEPGWSYIITVSILRKLENSRLHTLSLWLHVPAILPSDAANQYSVCATISHPSRFAVFACRTLAALRCFFVRLSLPGLIRLPFGPTMYVRSDARTGPVGWLGGLGATRWSQLIRRLHWVSPWLGLLRQNAVDW